MQDLKRKLLGALLVSPLASLMSACKVNAAGKAPTLTASQQRFKDMGLALVVDAVEGAEMLNVEFFADDADGPFYGKARMVKTNREIMSFPSGTVPEQVRVVWRKQRGITPGWWAHAVASTPFGEPIQNYMPPSDGRIRTNLEYLQEKIAKRKLIAKNINFIHQGPWGSEYGGEAAGDYTLPIASRIPDEVVKEIRKNGGGLRLKFRLKPDGVLFGWDIERFSGGLPRHSMPGGDFLETWY